ncbi:MAG: NBR1-Ig-like domain-containing protein, partial [Vicinamibacterales bacterium]
YRASVAVDPLAPLAAGERASAIVTVANTGTATWRAGAEVKTGHVRVGIQLLDASMRLVERDFARGGFAADIAPGGSATIEVPFAAPGRPGEYALKFDLVAEGVTWFEPVGSPVEVLRIRVS